MIGNRPQAACVVVAAENLVAVLLEQLGRIDARRPGLEVNGAHVDIRIVEGKRMSPQEAPRFPIEHEHAATLADCHDDLALSLIVWRNGGTDPLDAPGIGMDA